MAFSDLSKDLPTASFHAFREFADAAYLSHSWGQMEGSATGHIWCPSREVPTALLALQIIAANVSDSAKECALSALALDHRHSAATVTHRTFSALEDMEDDLKEKKRIAVSRAKRLAQSRKAKLASAI